MGKYKTNKTPSVKDYTFSVNHYKYIQQMLHCTVYPLLCSGFKAFSLNSSHLLGVRMAWSMR